jgi:hypothetical protein
MSVYRRGSSGSGVRELQEALNAAGDYGLAVDGRFGPATEKALRDFQRKNDLKVDGIAGSMTLGELGITATTRTGSRRDYTDLEVTRFTGLPGKPDVWKNKDTGQWMVVYYVPGTDPPVPMIYTIPGKDNLDVMFGDKDPKPDKIVTTAQINSTGGMTWGSTDMIPKESADKDPWGGFMERMNRALDVQPWLEDPEAFALQASGWLEGRSIERWEWEELDWFQNKTKAEQDWLWLTARSPEEARAKLEADNISVYDRFRNIGVMEPAEEVVDYMARQFSTGVWTQQFLDEQITAMFGGDTAVPLDAKLGELMRDNEMSVQDPLLHTNRVRDLYTEWLGPAHKPSDTWIQKWSQRLRDDEQAGLEMLTDGLRNQRKALYPQYDESLTYDDIAQPWRGFYARQWGVETPDETDVSFQRLIKLNDTEEGAKYMRKEGMKRGIEKVERDALSDLGANVSQVQRSV